MTGAGLATWARCVEVFECPGSFASAGVRRGATRARGSSDALSLGTVCRERARERVTVTVTRRSGRGPFAVRVAWPG